MKITTETIVDETNVQSQTFKINTCAQAFDILSNKLYEYKIQSITRELLSNAVDAHKFVKTDKPIEIHTSNSTFEQLIFKIKDYGPGLSEQDIIELYTTYFGSNKNNTNEFIGGFGLGSKSPFAYTDSFMVESRFGNKKSTYLCFKNESGPQVSKISEEVWTEDTGLTVSFNLKNEIDETKFLDEALRLHRMNDAALVKFVGKYEKYNDFIAVHSNYKSDTFEYHVNGCKFFKDNHIKLSGKFDCKFGTFKSKEQPTPYYNYYSALECHKFSGLAVHLGIEDYVVSLQKILDVSQIPFVMAMMEDYNFLINLPIGTIDLTASRETISYTPRTIQFFTDFLNKLNDSLRECITTFIEKKSLREKYLFLSRHYLQKIDLTEVGFKVNNFKYYEWSKICERIPNIKETELYRKIIKLKSEMPFLKPPVFLIKRKSNVNNYIRSKLSSKEYDFIVVSSEEYEKYVLNSELKDYMHDVSQLCQQVPSNNSVKIISHSLTNYVINVEDYNGTFTPRVIADTKQHQKVAKSDLLKVSDNEEIVYITKHYKKLFNIFQKNVITFNDSNWITIFKNCKMPSKIYVLTDSFKESVPNKTYISLIDWLIKNNTKYIHKINALHQICDNRIVNISELCQALNDTRFARIFQIYRRVRYMPVSLNNQMFECLKSVVENDNKIHYYQNIINETKYLIDKYFEASKLIQSWRIDSTNVHLVKKMFQ